jgi:hypothetical protein
MSPSSPTRVGDAVDHTSTVPKPTMSFLRLQQCHRPWAHNIVCPMPFLRLQRCRPVLSPGPQHHRHLRACDIVIPALSQSPRHHQTGAVLEPAMLSSSPKSVRVHYIFFFVILSLQILILICYIDTLLWYATLPLTYRIALMCYIAFDMLHCSDMLHCHIALICYIAFNMLHSFDRLHCFWYAALLWYATLPHCFDMQHCFVLLHCFDMLHCHIALICYTLLHCFSSATFWSILMHTTLLNDESGLSEMSVTTWTNIIVLLRFLLQTTCSKYGIRLSSSLSQSRWSFLPLRCHRSACEAFSDDRSNNTTLHFFSTFSTESRTTN